MTKADYLRNDIATLKSLKHTLTGIYDRYGISDQDDMGDALEALERAILDFQNELSVLDKQSRIVTARRAMRE